MKKFLSLSSAFFLSVVFFGCRAEPEKKPEASNNSNGAAQASKTPNIPPKSEQTIPIDVARFANKSSAELDDFFGAPRESATVENGGAYRLYKIAGQSKGLAVRFYGGRAKSFNLISDNAFPTSKEALKQIFNIDVGKSAPQKDAREPLSETYQGTFGDVKFKKVSAKRAGDGKRFIFVLAEVAE